MHNGNQMRFLYLPCIAEIKFFELPHALQSSKSQKFFRMVEYSTRKSPTNSTSKILKKENNITKRDFLWVHFALREGAYTSRPLQK